VGYTRISVWISRGIQYWQVLAITRVAGEYLLIFSTMNNKTNITIIRANISELLNMFTAQEYAHD